jgi:hypothetical protein
MNSNRALHLLASAALVLSIACSGGGGGSGSSSGGGSSGGSSGSSGGSSGSSGGSSGSSGGSSGSSGSGGSSSSSSGGSSSSSGGLLPPKATKLTYADPAAVPAGWRLVADAASTATRLVLDLVGPSDGATCRGVGFTLESDPKVIRFGKFTDGDGKFLGYHADGGVLRDLDAAGNAQPVTLQASGVTGGKLMVGAFQRTDDEAFGAAGTTPKDCSKVVLQIAIELDPALNAQPGQVPLRVVKARALGGNLRAAGRRTADVAVSVGTLRLEE